jgi:hypothetical protein
VALLRPPSALWGYSIEATDAALGRIAQVVTERDVEIAALRRQLAELRGEPGPQSPEPGVAEAATPADDAVPDDAAAADAGTGSGG